MPSSKVRSTRAAEFLGLVSFALALMLLISLATYDPSDPSPFFNGLRITIVALAALLLWLGVAAIRTHA